MFLIRPTSDTPHGARHVGSLDAGAAQTIAF
jgi:hypothetical protein